MSHNVARRAYSAEELLALRRSASDEPAMAIEDKVGASGIKDHVLRSNRSFGTRSTPMLVAPSMLRPPSETHLLGVPVLGEIDPNNQTVTRAHIPGTASPTPSLKKRKAEEILKQHGSPPGFRVTAGGRIVPSDQSPLCSPRYGYSAINKNGGLIRFAPGYPPQANTFNNFAKSLPNGFVAQDPDGRLCQMVDGRFLPIQEVNGIPQLYITAPNINNIGNAQAPNVRTDSGNGSPTRSSGLGNALPTRSGPTYDTQINALEKQYTKLEAERRDLDKAEVLQRTAMTSKAYNQLIQKRRELVSRLDGIRRSLKSLRDARSRAESTPPRAFQPSPDTNVQHTKYQPPPLMVPSMPYSGWPIEGQSGTPNAMPPYGFDPIFQDYSVMSSQPYFAGPLPPFAPMQPFFPLGPVPPPFQGPPHYQSLPMAPVPQQYGEPFQPAGHNTACQGTTGDESIMGDKGSVSENGARSRALPIKQPDPAQFPRKSVLNPMSPSYQPGMGSSPGVTPDKKQQSHRSQGGPQSHKAAVALADAVRAHNEWADDTGDSEVLRKDQNSSDQQQTSSEASFTTADFFPQNPRDHSMNKQVYPIPTDSMAAKAASVQPLPPRERPVTPEVESRSTNWNPPIPDHVFQPAMPLLDRGDSDVPERTDPTQLRESLALDPVLNRSALNVSPKNRRPNFLQKHKPISEMAVFGSPRPASPSGGTDIKDFLPTPKPQEDLPDSNEYIEGFQAGLARAPVGPQQGPIFLDGYCTGLLKSAQLQESMTTSMTPTKSAREPLRSSSSRGNEGSLAKSLVGKAIGRPPFELKIESLDTLKEAVFAPQNENAILSPESVVPDRPLDDLSKSHRAPEANDKALLPAQSSNVPAAEGSGLARTSSSHRISSSSVQTSAGTGSQHRAALDPKHASQQPGKSDRPQRTASSQSQPVNTPQNSYFQRAYPGHRVLSSPAFEWKSASSIAQVAGLATGYFAQFDGTLNDMATLPGSAHLTRASTVAGQDEGQTPAHMKPLPLSPRFQEATMPSDEPVVSPVTSPQGSPSKKSLSPAKVKFAQIAGRAGIKVRSDRPVSKAESIMEPEHTSPQDKRRWRDVWRKRSIGPQDS